MENHYHKTITFPQFGTTLNIIQSQNLFEALTSYCELWGVEWIEGKGGEEITISPIGVGEANYRIEHIQIEVENVKRTLEGEIRFLRHLSLPYDTQTFASLWKGDGYKKNLI